MKLIGLTGVAGSGKSTVAQYLAKEHGFTRLSFAMPLKVMLRTLNPVIGLDSEGDEVRLDDLDALGWTENDLKTSKYGKEYRRLLQVLGTDCIRAVDEDFWVRAGLAQMGDGQGKYVFDDCRFPNEAAVISNFNASGLWNIQRDGYGAVNGHVSEQHAGRMGEGIVIHNNQAEDALYRMVDDALAIAFTEVAA